MTRALTIGTFDLPHMGHAAFLRKCEQFGELAVGINTDRFVLEYKHREPIYSEKERATLVNALGYRTYFNDSAGRVLITELEPDVIVVGSDWARKDYYEQIDVDQDFLDAYKISIAYVPYTPGISTSEIMSRLQREEMQV